MDLENKFLKASKEIKTLSYLPNERDLLILYGLYKQSTIGDINKPKPKFWETKQIKKWNSWNSFKSLSKDKAMQKYINLVNSLKK